MDANTCNDTDPRDFGPVRIGWTCGIDGGSCAVRVSWQEQLIVVETLDRQRPRLDFSIRTEAAPYQRVSGALLFEPDNGTLHLLQLSYPGGRAGEVLLGCCKPLPPPPPPTEDETEVEQAIISEAGNLFPYIYLRAWPAATAQALADRFIFYSSDCVPDDPRLFCQLTAIDQSQPGAREAMIEQALLFVQGQPPYAGQFADMPAALGPGFAALAEFAVLAGQWTLPTPQALIGLIVTLWGEPWPVIVEVLQSEEFGKRLDRAWQNVFALNCLLGYDRGTLAGMIRVIVATHLLQRLAQAHGPEALEIEWPPERLRDGLRATLVLPAPVFPLPSALPEVANEGEPLSILPYAIGDLHLVKRRLLGYELGEVSHVESVMADEKKLRAQHELIEDESRQASQTQSEVAHDDARTGSGSSFDAQVQNTLREQFQVDYSTNYGPPQEARQTGSYTLKPLADQPTGEAASQQVDLARRITQRAAQRVSNSLTEQRLHHRRHARQSEVSQCFDRRGRSENQRGIYRWLDARYRCWVVRVGRRLMLEFFVPRPAERLIAAQRELSGIDLAEPVPPTQLGVYQFEDISLDPTSERYYAVLAARYGVDAVEPPPPELAYASAVFEAGTPLLSQVMALPEGYAAALATLSLATTVAGLTAQGRIGASAFAVIGDGADGAQTIALAGQTRSLPIAAAISAPPSNTAEDTSAENYYGLNVEVKLQRTPFALARWKSSLYGQLLDGFRRQRAIYLQAAGVTSTHGLNPLAWQRTIRREIKRAGLRGFLRLAARRTGELAREMRFAPALRLWLEQALEWSEMTYTLIDDLETAAAPLRQIVSGDGEQFTEFLQAAHARVLLPVAPAYEQALAYFLASGMVWNGEDTLAPTFDTPLEDDSKGPPSTACYVDLVDDLKSATPMLAPTCAQDTWTLTLPTTMNVLQDGDRLPEFSVRA